MNQTNTQLKRVSHPRWSIRFTSLRTRLFVTSILLVLLPVSITGAVATYISSQGLTTDVFDQLESVVTLKESQVQDWLASLQTNLDMVFVNVDSLESVSELVLNQAPDGQQKDLIRADLTNNSQRSGYFTEIFVMDKDGQVIVSTESDQEGKIMTTQSFFHEGIKGPYITPPAYELSLSNYTIVISQPLVSNTGKTIGVVAGRVNLNTLDKIMQQRTGLGETGETYMVSSNFAVLSKLRFGETVLGQTYIHTDGVTNAIKSKSNGSGSYPDYRTIAVAGVYHWVPELQVAIIAEQDESEALSAANRVFQVTLGLIVITVLAAGFAAFLTTQSIMGPVTKLATAAENIAKGNLDQYVDIVQQDEIGVLARSFNSMTSRLRELIGSLENRVAERTKALATVAEISTATSTILELDKLLQEIVNRSKEQFELYHSHIYLLDEKEENLTLASGAGEPGQAMMKQGFSIPFNREQSLVARAARERKGVTVNDVTQAPDFLPNPLLPNTRSELAVPMIVGGKLIGVFDVQSDIVGRFTDADISIQTTMASQIATSVQNARQVEKTIATAAELAGFQSAVSEAAIIAITDVSGKILQVNENLCKISKYSQEELIGQDHRILNSGYHTKEYIRNLWVTIANGKIWHGEFRNKAKDGSFYWLDTIISPILNEAGKPIRYVAIRYDITQRKELETNTARRAFQAETLNLITRKIQSATTVEDALQIAARELGHAMGMKSTVVTLEPSITQKNKQ